MSKPMDCGAELSVETKRMLSASFRGLLEMALRNVGPCVRCRATVLGLWREGIESIAAEQEAGVRERLEDKATRVEREGQKLVDELLGRKP